MNDCLSQLAQHALLNAMEFPIAICDRQGSTQWTNRYWTNQPPKLAKGMLLNIVTQAMKEDVCVNVEVESGCLYATALPATHHLPLVVVYYLSSDDAHMRLRKQLEESKTATASYQKKLSCPSVKNYIATSDAMIRIFTKAKQVAVYPTTILILGETGVGKEVISSFIHKNSDRHEQPFIKINCSAIPEPLMESELFGYERGAFTGAHEKGKIGLFELANHGTILLDEVGDMSLALQAKLLRTIQENEITRVGGSKPIQLDVRIISATSRDIEEMMSQGLFLDALYYRLNVVEIQIPPLRERREDILPLTEFYLQHFCEKYKLKKFFSQQARTCLANYTWPGNVRELRNIVENLVVSSLDNEIGTQEFPARMSARSLRESAGFATTGGSLRCAVETLQKTMIEQTLAQEGSLRKAASVLEVDPTTLHRLLKKLDIDLKEIK